MTCTPTSGSTFSLGTTPVSCTGIDGLGNDSAGSFNVIVRDQTPPTITTPGDSSVSVNGVTSVTVTFSVTSTAGTPSCVPPSGSSFSLGTNTVNCTATDSSGNTGSASFGITVQDTTPPTLNLPATQTVSINAATTANVSYMATAATGLPRSSHRAHRLRDRASAIGTTPCRVRQPMPAGTRQVARSTSSCRTTTSPIVSITGGPTGTVQSSTATIPFGADEGSLSCALDGGSFAACSSPVALSGLGDGPHTFQVRATDAAGNWERLAVVGSRHLAAHVHRAIRGRRRGEGPTGARATYSVTAADNGTPLLPSEVNCSPASGSFFPLGMRPVECTAADSLGNVGTVTFNVQVHDTTPPTLLAADITVAATSAAGIRRTDPAMVAYLGSLRGTDLVSSVQISTNAPAVFPIGPTALLVRATDGASNVTQRTVQGDGAPIRPGGPSAARPRSAGGRHATARRRGRSHVALSWVRRPRPISRRSRCGWRTPTG